MEYVCGFAMHGNRILLIHKLRPDWQRGRLNGVGGKIEPGETPWQAMVREFQEETGLATYESDWTNFATLQYSEGMVNFFHAEIPWETLKSAVSPTDELVHIVSGDEVTRYNCIPSLTWLIPMARNLRHEVSPRKAVHIVLTEVYE